MAKKNIYQVSENVIGSYRYIYVRATEDEIEERQFRGGFRRFNASLFAEGKDYPRGSEVHDCKPIRSIGKFDKWLKEHNCV